jgi:hypothetical protein
MAGLTIDDPVKFSQAIVSKRIIPGDVLELKGGTYAGDWVMTIAGTQAKPITIKPRAGENVVIDGSLKLEGDYIEMRDITIMDSRTDRTAATVGILASIAGLKLAGCYIHDLHGSGVSWWGGGAGQIIECIIANNGNKVGDKGHGHGIYTHNSGGARVIAKNLFFDSIGNYCLQIYSDSANYLKDYTVQDNVFAGDAVHTGGGLGLIDFVYERNTQFEAHCQHGRYSYDNQNRNGRISGNTFIDLSAYSVNADCAHEWDNLTEADNLVYGGEPSDRAGYTVMEKPATLTRWIPYTQSTRWLGAAVIYNRDSAEQVAFDFTGLLEAGSYRLRNYQNMAETWDFEYTTGSVNVPTAWTAAARIGDITHPPTWPVFGALLVEQT